MDVTKVTAAKPKVTGAIFNAPSGTVLPKDATETLNEAFCALGYIGEDGLTNTNSPTCENVKAWGGDIVLTVQTEKPDQYKFKLIEAMNTDVLKAVYGSDNVAGEVETGLTIKANSKEIPSSSWVIEMILKDGAIKRIVIPHGTISAVEDIVYSEKSPVGYGVTLTANPDATGNTHYEYIKKA